jgi:pre-mRNA-processing factor 19
MLQGLLARGEASLTLPVSTALTTCAFHPDGHLFAAGTQDGTINVFSTKTGEPMAAFSLGASVSALAFSENGYWFAAGSDATANVVIFDLRKEGDAARAKELPTTGAVRALAWDYSAQFLAVAGPGGVAVHYYAKSAKKWSVVLETGARARAVQWGEKAQSLSALGEEGQIIVLGQSE